MSCGLQLDEHFKFHIARQLAKLLEYLGIGTFRRGNGGIDISRTRAEGIELGYKSDEKRSLDSTDRRVRLPGHWLSCLDQYDDSKWTRLLAYSNV